MSALKKQLKELLPSLSKQANKIQDPEIKKRFYLIKAVCESSKDVKKTCEVRGISTDYFYKWGVKLLKQGSLDALRPGSRAPKRFWNLTPQRISKRVIAMKKKKPFYGQERISFYLKKLFNIVCAPSTVYGILKRAGLVHKEYRERRTKKHIKRYRRPIPGYLQMDIKYVPFLINDEQYYEFNIVDHCTSWRLMRAYRHRGVEELKEFLSELSYECPFPIFEIQTDNDKAFTDKYSKHLPLGPSGDHYLDLWCLLRGVRHKLIPI